MRVLPAEVPDDVARTSAGMFTLSYGGAVVIALICGAAWDMSGMPALAFLLAPITAASSTVRAPICAPKPTTLSRTTAPAPITVLSQILTGRIVAFEPMETFLPTW